MSAFNVSGAAWYRGEVKRDLSRIRKVHIIITDRGYVRRGTAKEIVEDYEKEAYDWMFGRCA